MALWASTAALGCGAESGWAPDSHVRLLSTGLSCETSALEASHARVGRAWHSAIAAPGCSAEGRSAPTSRVRLAHLMSVTLMLSVHGTRRGDGIIDGSAGGSWALILV
eukprot:2734397-Prymnesium_polylepis.1